MFAFLQVAFFFLSLLKHDADQTENQTLPKAFGSDSSLENSMEKFDA